MKTRLTYTVLRGALLGVVLVLTACVNTLELATPNGRNRSQDREQAIREAVAYFDNHRALLTRSAEAEPTEEAPFVVGDIVVDWESAVAVSNDEKRYTDFTMRKDNRFYLLLEQEGEQMEAVELYSRFASVEDFGLDTMNQYVATYIPDVEYLQSYYAVAQDYGINCAEWYEFSGVVLYTMLSGHHIAAYRYEGGELAKRAFLYDREQTDEENIADFCSVMEGLTLGVASQQDDTRVVVDNEDKPVEIEEIIIYDKPFPTIFKPQIIGEEDDDNQIVEPTIIGITLPLIGGGGSSSTDEDEKDEPTAEELVEDLFDTEGLSDEQKDKVGKMLQEIIKDCMGEELYSQLVEMGETNITISFDPNRRKPSSYNRDSHSIVLTNFHSDVLLHEMFHIFQHHQVELKNPNNNKFNSYTKASANYEVEAQIARYVFLLRRKAYDTTNRYERYCSTSLGSSIQNAGDYIDANGRPYIDVDNYHNEYYSPSIDKVLAIAKDKQVSITYNESFSMDDNLSNLQTLSQYCN